QFYLESSLLTGLQPRAQEYRRQLRRSHAPITTGSCIAMRTYKLLSGATEWQEHAFCLGGKRGGIYAPDSGTITLVPNRLFGEQQKFCAVYEFHASTLEKRSSPHEVQASTLPEACAPVSSG